MPPAHGHSTGPDLMKESSWGQFYFTRGIEMEGTGTLNVYCRHETTLEASVIPLFYCCLFNKCSLFCRFLHY